MNIKQTLILLSVFIFVSMSCQENSRSLEEVKINDGIVSGKLSDDQQVVAFKGIPFAAPPVGNLRWKAPQPTTPWQGVLACDQFSASAMQPKPEPFFMWTSEFIAPAEPLSEDCLYLNVWTSAKNKGKKQPVMVFIHGGGFGSGSGSVPIYDGEEMAKKGVVFVTINYRLGIFGFLAHPELSAEAPYGSSGNYGLLDQVAALKWVNGNIAAFGGDPNNVTIAGQSAGAFSVNYLIASPLAKGLFHRAIAESGGAILDTDRDASYDNLTEAEKNGKNLEQIFDMQSIEELRQIPAEELLKTQIKSRPIVDGYFLPTDVYSIFAEGKQNDVPLLLGWNANEGNFGGPIVDATIFKQYAEEKYGEESSWFLELFPASDDEEAKESQMTLSGLQTFGLQVFKWMTYQNKTGKSDVFMYHFTRELPFGEGQQNFRAFHSGEVPYAYKNLRMSNVRPWKPVDYELQEKMSTYWVNFAKKGNPNEAGLAEWIPCKSENYLTMYFGDDVDLKPIPHLAQLQFLERFYDLK